MKRSLALVVLFVVSSETGAGQQPEGWLSPSVGSIVVESDGSPCDMGDKGSAYAPPENPPDSLLATEQEQLVEQLKTGATKSFDRFSLAASSALDSSEASGSSGQQLSELERQQESKLNAEAKPFVPESKLNAEAKPFVPESKPVGVAMGNRVQVEMTSNHKASPEFQEAWIEASARKKERNKERKKEKLQRKHSDALAMREKLRDRFPENCSSMPVVLVALDMEAWEQDREKITEIGMASAKLLFVDLSPIHPSASHIEFHHRHILIREHLELRNGIYMEDNKDNFLFGDSEIMNLADAALFVSSELALADFIVGHAIKGDLAMLRKLGVTGIEPNSSSLERRLVDTQTLAKADAQPKLGLRALAEAFGLDPQRLHNGGNDAAFTLQVLLGQCGVNFVPPARVTSNHKASPEFQEAWLEASARLGGVSPEEFQEEFQEAQLESMRREQELRAHVATFAESTSKARRYIRSKYIRRKHIWENYYYLLFSSF